MKTYRSRGAITVFLSLISVLFLSLLCTSIESARIQGTRAKAAAALDMGSFSLFGEYENKLLEEYDIFALDGACGTGFYSKAVLEEKLIDYMTYNVSPNTGILLKGYDPFQVQLNAAEITGVSLLTDDRGAAFYQQAVAFMHDNLATEVLDVWLQRQEEANGLQEASNQYSQSEQQNGSELSSLQNQQKQEEVRQKAQLEEAKKEAEENGEIWVEEEPQKEKLADSENPLETIKKVKKKGIMNLVLGSGTEISGKKIDSDVVSKRHLSKGNLSVTKTYSGLSSNLLFQEYLFERFSKFGDKKQDSMLEYELEYILCGKNSDEKNLKAVVKKLLMLREGANFLYLSADSQKRTEAENLAMLVVGEIPIPGLVEVVAYALLLVWAYAESILDVRILMSGGKVPVWKDGESWHMELTDIPQLLQILGGANVEKSEKGLNYEGYLQILYSLGTKSKYSIRALDLVEHYLKNNGNPGFRADQAIVKIETKAEYTIPPMFLRISNAFLHTGLSTREYQATGTFSY